MGSRQSKVTESEQPQQPQLYAVATPHPTLQYIYPVYAAPVDVPQAHPQAQEKQGRRSPLAWRSDRSKTTTMTKEIQVVAEPEEVIQGYPAVAGPNEDGVWYHFHVDATGAVDYIRPGTTLPTTFAAEPLYIPQSPGESMAPSRSMAGVAYEESFYSYPTSSPYHGYYHPQPHRISQHSMGSGYPRPRSASPVQTRSMTPTNMRPRRATTPNPRGSRTPTYEPAPPTPQYVTPAARRSGTPFPRPKILPAPSSQNIEKMEYRSRSGTVPVPSSERRSRHTHARSEEESTVISSSHLREKASTTLKAISSQPYSPDPAQDLSLVSVNHRLAAHKHAQYYPSPSTPGSQHSLRA